MRKFKLTWTELCDILKKQGFVMDEESIKEMTLTKPKEVLFYMESQRSSNQ